MKNERWFVGIIMVVSVLVPLLVGYLFFGTEGPLELGIEVDFLPRVNAIINTLTALSLGAGLYFIRQGNVQKHKGAMLTAFMLSILFMVSYLTYHTATDHTQFGGTGFIQYVYYFILITHIILAAIIVPLALLTLYWGLAEQFGSHKRIARWTWPIWMYVAITGVVIYLMLSPYY